MQDIRKENQYPQKKNENKEEDVQKERVYVKPKVVRVRRILAAGGHKV